MNLINAQRLKDEIAQQEIFDYKSTCHCVIPALTRLFGDSDADILRGMEISWKEHNYLLGMSGVEDPLAKHFLKMLPEEGLKKEEAYRRIDFLILKHLGAWSPSWNQKQFQEQV